MQVLGGSTPDYIVEVLYNGVPVELPGCHTNQGVCSLQKFLVSTHTMLLLLLLLLLRLLHE